MKLFDKLTSLRNPKKTVSASFGSIKIKTKLFSISILVGTFLFLSIFFSFEAFKKLEGDASHINLIGNQIKRIFNSQLNIISYIESNDEEIRKKLFNNINEFEIARNALLGNKNAMIKISTVLKQIEEDEVILHLNSKSKIWSDYKALIGKILNQHENILTFLNNANATMKNVIIKNKELGERFLDVDNEDYFYYGEIIKDTKVQLIRAKIYLDGYISENKKDLIEEYLLNINVGFEKIGNYIEGIKYGSDKYDILALPEDDTESLKKLGMLQEFLEDYQKKVNRVIAERNALILSQKKSKRLSDIIIDGLDKTGNLLQLYSETKITNKKNLDLFLLIMSLLLIIILIIITFSITKPLDKTVNMIKQMSKGGLLKNRLNLIRKDEIGQMAQSLDHFADTLQNTLMEVIENSKSLANSSKQLTEISQTMEKGVTDLCELANSAEENTGKMAQEVSLASKETENSASKVNDVSFSIITVSQDMASIVDTAELVSSNMNNAGATVNQLSSSITEVCGNTLQASNISDHLMQKVNESKTLMENLGNRAQSVGKVIDVINSIAKMTDLLALNAKIEAVNAGKAGKSFVVVADEVKDLSNKTAMATKEVEKMIKEMQSSASLSINSINDIASTLNELKTINNNIAASMEEQDAASQEVASSALDVVESMESLKEKVKKIADGSSGVASNTKELSVKVLEISKEGSETVKKTEDLLSFIRNMVKSAKNNLVDAKRVHSNAGKLDTLAEKLKILVSTFTSS